MIDFLVVSTLISILVSLCLTCSWLWLWTILITWLGTLASWDPITWENSSLPGQTLILVAGMYIPIRFVDFLFNTMHNFSRQVFSFSQSFVLNGFIKRLLMHPLIYNGNCIFTYWSGKESLVSLGDGQYHSFTRLKGPKSHSFLLKEVKMTHLTSLELSKIS